MLSKIIAQQLIEKTSDAIQNAEQIIITSHVAPDGDALGASLGLWHYLLSLDKQVTVILPSDYPAFLSWMPGTQETLIYSKNKKEADEFIEQAELIFVLDLNNSKRLDTMESAILGSNAKKILIDHHLHPDDFVDICISYPDRSSTSELIFRLICRMGAFEKITLASAECIYTGMMTDTGGFSYNSNDPEIYSIIYELIKIGINKDSIYRKVFNTYSAERLRLMGMLLYRKMKIYPEYQAALITLTTDEMKEFSYVNGDSEGFVNIPLSIEGIVFSVFMREESDKIKISLRSQGTFPANKVANELFNGGGHLNAAGAESYATLDETIQIFERSLINYSDYLEKE